MVTIQDLEDLYYGTGAGYIQKADAPILSSTTGVYNAIYGAKVWSQLNQESNAFGILPKKVWDKSGWRVVTTRAAATDAGLAEGATLPDSIKPTFAEVSASPKSVGQVFQVSEVAQFVGNVDDGLGDTLKLAREEMGKHHIEMVNVNLLADVGTAVAGNAFESIDRVASSNAEVTTRSLTANRADIYGLDRDAGASWTDAYVDSAASNRGLTLNMLDTAYQNVWTNGGRPKVILTKPDTLMKIQQLLQAQQRFVDRMNVVPSVNGIQGFKGVDAGFLVATYNGVPLIHSKDVVADSSAKGRIYILDTDTLYVKVAKPTQYFETGMDTGNPFVTNSLTTKGLYRTMGELICTRFKSQAKIGQIT